MNGDRVILHCDCNSFFASVETALNPSLRNVPMAVGGSEEARHGIILAKNELAKAYHVETAETIWSAKQKCPDLVIVPPHYEEYVRYSHETDEIFRRYTDRIERFGIDEAWLDVTGSSRLFGSGHEIADKIREDVKRELGITVSVGVSFNKVFAKLGSDYKKPDAVTEITRENVARIAYPMPASALLFVGRKTTEALLKYNIRTIGDIASSSRAFLTEKLGKAGGMLYDYAVGNDNSPVTSIFDEEPQPKSVGNGMTFRHDLTCEDEIRIGLLSLSEEIATRLRRVHLKAGTVALTVKGTDLRTVTKQRQLLHTSAIGREIYENAFETLVCLWHIGKPIRALTVTAMNLVSEHDTSEQISLFEALDPNAGKRGKIERMESTLDKIREKYGYTALVPGAVLHNDIGICGSAKTEAEREAGKEKKDTND